MTVRKRPPGVILAAALLGVFACESVFRFTRSIVEILDSSTINKVGATVILVGIAVIAISIGVLPLVLVITGRRGATVITTLVAIWQLSELATVGDLISWILAPLAVLAIVAIWLPSSRRFIVARDPKQNSVNLVDH